MDKGEQIEQALGSAIAEVMNNLGGGFVVKWISLIEIINDDGHRGLWTTTSDGLTAWDTCGLLTHALHMQQSATLEGKDE